MIYHNSLNVWSVPGGPNDFLIRISKVEGEDVISGIKDGCAKIEFKIGCEFDYAKTTDDYHFIQNENQLWAFTFTNKDCEEFFENSIDTIVNEDELNSVFQETIVKNSNPSKNQSLNRDAINTFHNYVRYLQS